VSRAAAAQTVVLPWNDASAATTAFATRPGAIAAVIVEPVVANMGLLPPQPGFLEHLRELTRADGALLIFDEVITGFRLGPGGAQARFAVRPDMTTLGKVIGGGMPIGAYGGRADLMALVAPEGQVYQAGTLSGHPLAMAAGIATLTALTPESYVSLEAMAERLERGARRAAVEAGTALAVTRVGSLLGVAFRSTPPIDAEEAADVDRDAFSRFFAAMLDRGILLPPSPFEAWFLSLSHGEAEIDDVIGAAEEALRT
jgi:glutamate-1-semialdehyde 2,1-aminomutase